MILIVEKILIIGPEFFGYNESVEKAYKKIEEIDSINRDKCRKVGLTHSIENFTKEYEKLYKNILGE